MQSRKSTHRRGAPGSAHLPVRATDDREVTTGTGGPELMAVGGKGGRGMSFTMGVPQQPLKGPSHEKRRNTAIASCGLERCSDISVRGSHAASRLLDARNSAARRSPANATAGDDRCTGPRAERGTEKARSTCDAGNTRRWHCTSLSAANCIATLSPLPCYGFSSCLRSGGGGLGQFWPYFQIISWPQIRTPHTLVSETLDGDALLNRHTTNLPIAKRADCHSQMLSKHSPSANQAGCPVNRVFIRKPG